MILRMKKKCISVIATATRPETFGPAKRSVFLLGFFLFATSMYAQEGFSIRGTFYELGMTKAEVAIITPDEVEIRDFTGGRSHGTFMFFIQHREDYYEQIGQADFLDGRVHRLTRPIGTIQLIGYTSANLLDEYRSAFERVVSGLRISPR